MLSGRRRVRGTTGGRPCRHEHCGRAAEYWVGSVEERASSPNRRELARHERCWYALVGGARIGLSHLHYEETCEDPAPRVRERIDAGMLTDPAANSAEERC